MPVHLGKLADQRKADRMPEGDTVHKIAQFLAPRLTGVMVEQVKLPDADTAKRCSGQRVRAVVARGKHLFIELDNELTIRSHLGMHGSWHRYPHATAWQRPRSQLSLALSTADWEYVCFNAKEVEIVRSPSVRRRIVHTRLGVDLIADHTDPAYLARRARAILDADALLIDALLDQRIACGIGNVYKSEILFIERLSPDLLLTDLDDDSLGECFQLGTDLLRRNLGGGRRTTRFEHDDAGSLWVYGRNGLPCLRCDTPIQSRRMGRHHRSTYWCPACQLDSIHKTNA